MKNFLFICFSIIQNFKQTALLLSFLFSFSGLIMRSLESNVLRLEWSVCNFRKLSFMALSSTLCLARFSKPISLFRSAYDLFPKQSHWFVTKLRTYFGELTVHRLLLNFIFLLLLVGVLALSTSRSSFASSTNIRVVLACLGKKLGELLAGIMQNKRMGVLVFYLIPIKPYFAQFFLF